MVRKRLRDQEKAIFLRKAQRNFYSSHHILELGEMLKEIHVELELGGLVALVIAIAQLNTQGEGQRNRSSLINTTCNLLG